MASIVVTGQCTLHWGRLEFGNIGNYYVTLPLFERLRATFPQARIRTTFQLSEALVTALDLDVLPMEYYYGWTGADLANAEAELAIAREHSAGRSDTPLTPYLSLVAEADLVIDFSGDIWGANADLIGADRFRVGLLKDRCAQLLCSRTAMIVGSPGPFSDDGNIELAREVYAGFDLVTNREAESTRLLEAQGFDLSRTRTTACPAFTFRPAPAADGRAVLRAALGDIADEARPLVGVALCGWNMREGPFDREDWRDEEFSVFAGLIEALVENAGCSVVLISHSNGFDIPPAPFRLKHGRDYPLIKQLQRVLAARGCERYVRSLDEVCEPALMKSLIGELDVMVSGRVHAAVAALSQGVPTTLIDYGHEPKAHKVRGFAAVAGAERFVVDPSRGSDLLQTVTECLARRQAIGESLASRQRVVRQLVDSNFESLRALLP